MLSALKSTSLQSLRSQSCRMSSLLAARSRVSVIQQVDSCASPLRHSAKAVVSAGGTPSRARTAFLSTPVQWILDARSADRANLSHCGWIASSLRRLGHASSVAASASKLEQRTGRDEQQADSVEPATVVLPQYCSGCGVKLQTADPATPGYAGDLSFVSHSLMACSV